MGGSVFWIFRVDFGGIGRIVQLKVEMGDGVASFFVGNGVGVLP